MTDEKPVSFLRLFVAIPLPEELKTRLTALAAAYAQHPALRFVPPQNLHLTLHFIGNVAPQGLPEIDHALEGLAAGSTPFELHLQELAPGPSVRSPRLLWARFASHDKFEQVSLRMAEAIGLSRNPHPHPIPHVTLARFRKDHGKPLDLPVTPAPEPTLLQVTSFALWQSTLGQPHPHYHILKEYPLGKVG